jgi:hypothetical protein
MITSAPLVIMQWSAVFPGIPPEFQAGRNPDHLCSKKLIPNVAIEILSITKMMTSPNVNC